MSGRAFGRLVVDRLVTWIPRFSSQTRTAAEISLLIRGGKSPRSASTLESLPDTPDEDRIEPTFFSSVTEYFRLSPILFFLPFDVFIFGHLIFGHLLPIFMPDESAFGIALRLVTGGQLLTRCRFVNRVKSAGLVL